MPCYTVQYAEVDTSKYNTQVLTQALHAMGLTWVTASTAHRIASRSLSQEQADQLPAAYAEATIRTAARRQGWQVKQDQRNPRKFALIKG